MVTPACCKVGPPPKVTIGTPIQAESRLVVPPAKGNVSSPIIWVVGDDALERCRRKLELALPAISLTEIGEQVGLVRIERHRALEVATRFLEAS
jgi:hypothetical protein